MVIANIIISINNLLSSTTNNLIYNLNIREDCILATNVPYVKANSVPTLSIFIKGDLFYSG